MLLVGGLFLAAWASPWIESRVAPEPLATPILQLARSFLIALAALSAGAALGFGAALILMAPILDRLSRRVEAKARGFLDDRGQGLAWEVAQSLRGALYFLAAAPGIFVLAFIPILGPILAFL